jgi:hypothetical protein
MVDLLAVILIRSAENLTPENKRPYAFSHTLLRQLHNLFHCAELLP